MIEHLAMRWWHLDQLSVSDPEMLWANVPDDDKVVVRNRVFSLLSGQILPSDMSPADRLVAIGRKRCDEDLDEFARKIDELMFGKPGWNEEENRVTRWHNWWDSLVGPSCKSVYAALPIQQCSRLYGNANIGNLNLCNLQIPGQLGCDQVAYMRYWYVDTEVTEANADLLEEAFHNSVATVTVGNRPVAQLHLSELFYDVCKLDELLPTRQNFSVELSFFSRANDILSNALKSPLRVHIEGALQQTVY